MYNIISVVVVVCYLDYLETGCLPLNSGKNSIHDFMQLFSVYFTYEKMLLFKQREIMFIKIANNAHKLIYIYKRLTCDRVSAHKGMFLYIYIVVSYPVHWTT